MKFLYIYGLDTMVYNTTGYIDNVMFRNVYFRISLVNKHSLIND